MQQTTDPVAALNFRLAAQPASLGLALIAAALCLAFLPWGGPFAVCAAWFSGFIMRPGVLRASTNGATSPGSTDGD